MGDDMIDYKAIGRKIAYYRKGKHYTQAELAEKLGVSNSYMSQTECGKIKVSLRRLDQISELLEVDIVMLLSDTNVNAKNYCSTELFELIENWSPEQKEALLALVKCADEQIISTKKK